MTTPRLLTKLARIRTPVAKNMRPLLLLPDSILTSIKSPTDHKGYREREHSGGSTSYRDKKRHP